MNIKKLADELVKVIKKHRHILIAIQGSPDPDAIAAAYVFKLICEAYGTRATIDSPIPPSLPQNKRIIKALDLPIRFESLTDLKSRYDAYAVFDHQSVDIEGLTGIVPCAVHVDHHEASKEKIPVDFKLVLEDVGSTSTIMAFFMEELKGDLKFGRSQEARAATALQYGIQTDTSDLKYATPLDREALDLVSPHSDKNLLKKISSLPFPKEGLQFLTRALQNDVVYKDWLICGIGFMDRKYRDTIAIIGDFLLEREDISTVVVFSIIERGNGLCLDASFRTRRENFNLNAFIKKMSRQGGARKYKGAYQVNLDYFKYCPDKEFLWDLVFATTIETLKIHIDRTNSGILKRFFRKIKQKWADIVPG